MKLELNIGCVTLKLDGCALQSMHLCFIHNLSFTAIRYFVGHYLFFLHNFLYTLYARDEFILIIFYLFYLIEQMLLLLL